VKSACDWLYFPHNQLNGPVSIEPLGIEKLDTRILHASVKKVGN
jgi:hypothetical protein